MKQATEQDAEDVETVEDSNVENILLGLEPSNYHSARRQKKN
jgi:hypothetical protein